MENITYANLHHKTHYSCGQAIGKSIDGIRYAKELGLSALAITDKATMGGVFDFLKCAKKEEYPAIIGCELDVFFDGSQTFEIVLLVQNQTGYHNLCRILTHAHRNSYKFNKAACSIADLFDFSDGLVCLTGSIRGPFGQDFLTLPHDKAHQNGIRRLKELHSIFTSNLYLELTLSNEMYQWDQKAQSYIQKFSTNPQITVNKALIQYGETKGIKCVITSNSEIPRPDDKTLQDVVVRNSIKGKQGYSVRENNHLFNAQEIRSRGHLQKLPYKTIEACLTNTLEVASKCTNPKLQFKGQVVDYPIIFHPLHREGMDKEGLVQAIIKDFGRMQEGNKVYTERLTYELDTIIRNGKINLIDYFLVVEDLCRWCRDNGIVVGPGRGSGAGSLLNYCLQITHLDPIPNGLLFERFISEARILKGTYPDIDLDFSDQPRVKQYLGDMYGWDRVRPIATYQTMRVKTSIKDAFRLYYPKVEFHQINKITTSFPKKEELESELEYYERSVEEKPVIKRFLYELYPKAGETIERLIGFNRQTGVHPCGIAITQDPLDSLAPIVTIRGKECLDFNLDACEHIGIIKYDALSVVTLKYIQTAVLLIKERCGVDIDIYNMPTDDEKVLHSFLIETAGTFQFDSDVARSILTKIECHGLEDLSLVTSAGRPGPMANDQHIEFIRRKRGMAEVTPPHPALEETLRETYGIMMYQESVMKASQILGGFSLAEADDIRKAMGYKKKHILKPYKDRFVKFAVANYDDIDQEKGEEIWHLMETFAGYGFNKSHSMSYAYIGYICQYLKIYYPLEWWFSCLKHSLEKPEKFGRYYLAGKKFVRLPHINLSTNEFEIAEDDMIQMPFSSVKGVGVKANAEIFKHRPYESLEDFYNKVAKRVIHKGVFEKLIFGGAFDCFCKDKEELLHEYYVILRKDKVPEKFEHMHREKIIEYEKLSLDFLLIDYYKIYPTAFYEENLVDATKIEGINDGNQIVVGGRIKSLTVAQTKHKDDYGVILLENANKEAKVKLWPEEFRQYKSKLTEGNIIKLKAKVNYWNNYPQIIGTHVFTIPEAIQIANNRR